MGWLNSLRAVFGGPTVAPSDATKLAASSQSTLAASIRPLPEGEKGWITLRDAGRLFSRADEAYAFGELDEDGKRRIEEFAAATEHHSTVDIMPVEGRVYFTRR